MGPFAAHQLAAIRLPAAGVPSPTGARQRPQRPRGAAAPRAAASSGAGPQSGEHGAELPGSQFVKSVLALGAASVVSLGAAETVSRRREPSPRR